MVGIARIWQMPRWDLFAVLAVGDWKRRVKEMGREMPKKGWIIAGIVVLLLALALIIFKWVTAPIELDFEVQVKDAKLTDFVDEWGDIDQEKWEDYFSREEDFTILQYEFEYWSDRDLRAEEDFSDDEEILLGVFFDVFYPNELNSRIFGHTCMRDMELTYVKDRVYTNRIRVVIEKKGLTDEQILELGQQVQIQAIGLDKYYPEEIIKKLQQD